jgi:cytochrome c
MRNALLASVVLIGVISASGFGFQHKPKMKAKPVVHYAEVQKVLNANCVKCHGGKRPKGGINLTSYAGVLAGGEDGPIVKAGSPNDSVLIKALTGKGAMQMPPAMRGAKPIKLPAKTIQTVSDWIKAGAKKM